MKTPLDLLEESLNAEPLAPTLPAPNAITGPQLVYWTKPRSGKHGPRLHFSFRPDLIEQLMLEHGDHIRLEADLEKRIGVLVKIVEKCPTGASRQIKITPTGRGQWYLPWSGATAAQFPAVTFPGTPVEILGHRPCAIFFKLPTQSPP